MIAAIVGYEFKNSESEHSIYYIQQNYGEFTDTDFRNAFTLWIQGKLELNVPDFVKINPRTIETVMGAYRRQLFVSNQRADVPERYMSPEEKDSIIVDCICQMYVNRSNGHPVTDFGGAMYRYFLRKNLIGMDEGTWAAFYDKAQAQYKVQSQKDSFKHFMTMRSGSASNVREALINDITGALIIDWYFDQHASVNLLRNAINPR